MLYDRDYMRDDDRPGWRSPVIVLLVVLGAIFLVECFLQVYAGSSLSRDFGLSYQAVVTRHEYWRLFTYQFLHDAPWPLHLLFNALGLWFFGRWVLETLGARRFWQIYLTAGFIGALVEIGCQAWHQNFGLTVGASGSVLGLAGVFCLLMPQRETTFVIYFFPVRMRSITMFWILFGFSLFGVLFPAGNIAYGAHLGGLLAGAAYAKFVLDDSSHRWWERFVPRRPAAPRTVTVAAGKVSARPERTGSAPAIPVADQESSEDFIRREVDPILDKISAHGIQSLTERERRVLEKARDRIKGQ